MDIVEVREDNVAGAGACKVNIAGARAYKVDKAGSTGSKLVS
jgi:hypothetical protein